MTVYDVNFLMLFHVQQSRATLIILAAGNFLRDNNLYYLRSVNIISLNIRDVAGAFCEAIG